MCFQSARFDARTDETGAIVLLADQNRSCWNQALIQKGHYYLNRSAEGDLLTEYHLEAGIAMLHCIAPAYEATNWPTILTYYDLLLTIKPSPVVALHRAVAIAKVKTPSEAIANVLVINGLESNHHFYAILGDLYEQNKQPAEAKQSYRRARELTFSVRERALLDRKLARLG